MSPDAGIPTPRSRICGAGYDAGVSSENARSVRAAILLYGAMGLGFAIVLLRRLADPHEIAQTDFTAFYSGWWLILQGRGGELYDVAAQRAAQHAILGDWQFSGGLLAFLHPPHAAVAGVPLGFLAARLGEPVAFWVWTAANVALLVDLARGTSRLVGAASPSARAVVATALLAFFPVFLTFREGQVALLLAVAFLRLYLATRDKRDVAAAGWLLVLSLKPQLLPIPIGLLVACRRFRTLAWGAGFGAAAMLVAAVVLGPGIFGRYLHGLGALQTHLGNGAPVGMVNLRGLLVRVLGGDRASVAAAIAFAALGVGAVAFGIAGGRRGWGNDKLPLAFAAAFGATLFLSPHLFVPDLALWVVPLGLAASASSPGSPSGIRFRRFALAWPIALAVALALGAWPRLFVEAATGLGLVALLWILRMAGSGRPRPAP